MIKRFTAAFLPGIIVSLFLFWLMNIMIMPEEKNYESDKVLEVANFTRVKRDQKDSKTGKQRQLPEMQKVQQRPETQPPPSATPPKSLAKAPTPKIDTPKINMGLSPSDIKIAMTADVQVAEDQPKPKPAPAAPTPPKAAAETAMAAPSISAPSMEVLNLDDPMGGGGDVVPLLQTPPMYPRRAQMRRIEGWVKVEFTITRDGSVDEIEIIDSKPSGIFEKAVLKALPKWRFEPRKLNGQPFAQRATQTLSFRLTR